MTVLNAMGMLVLTLWGLGLWGMLREKPMARYLRSRPVYWDRMIRESRSEYDANRALGANNGR